MKIKEIMTPKVQCINIHKSIREAAKIMRDLKVGSIPVEDNDKLVGMITDRDLVVTGMAEGKMADSTTIGECMSKGIKYCFEEEEIESVKKQMKDLHISRIPVMNHERRLVGIVSFRDIDKRAS